MSENEMTQEQIEELLGTIIILLPEYFDSIKNYDDISSQSRFTVPDILLMREVRNIQQSNEERAHSLFAVFHNLIRERKMIVCHDHSFMWISEVAFYDTLFVAARLDCIHSDAYADRHGFGICRCYDDGSYRIRIPR